MVGIMIIFPQIMYEIESVSKKGSGDSQFSSQLWKPKVLDHYESPNKFINALNLRKTSVYV